jgi:hypothetical protein
VENGTLMRPTLKRVTVTFTPEGIELAVAYDHDHVPANPGTRGRTTTAARMASKGLETALDALDRGQLVWGGFATSTRATEDKVIVEREEHAA